MLDSAYAFKNKQKDNSSSGGAFPSIVSLVAKEYDAESSIIVYGAAFDEEFNVKHIEIQGTKEIDKLCGSKYVRSDTSGIYNAVLSHLVAGENVIFSGTPCQVHSLTKFLKLKKCNTDRLLTIDIVCHGTILPDVWADYRKWLIKKHRSDIVDFSFRYQNTKWKSYPSMVQFANGKKYINSFDLRRYTEIFYSDLALCSACYNCRFVGNKKSVA